MTVHASHALQSPSHMRTATERLWTKFQRDADTGCWLWTASLRAGTPYGQFNLSGKIVGAHVAMYELLVGPVPEGLELDHLCGRPRCVNPSHLEPVTHAENIRRARERALGPQDARSCVRGHAMTEANSYRYRGRVACRICRCAASREWKRVHRPSRAP